MNADVRSILGFHRHKLPVMLAELEAPPPDDGIQMDVMLTVQRHSNWCWAAVAVMVANHYGAKDLEQCKVADLWLHDASCDDQPEVDDKLDICAWDKAGPAYNSPEPPNQPQVMWGPLQVIEHASATLASNGKPTLEELAGEIDAERPVCMLIKLTDGDEKTGGGHFVAITGYSEAKDLIHIVDPYRGQFWWTFSTFPADYQAAGLWSETNWTSKDGTGGVS